MYLPFLFQHVFEHTVQKKKHFLLNISNIISFDAPKTCIATPLNEKKDIFYDRFEHYYALKAEQNCTPKNIFQLISFINYVFVKFACHNKNIRNKVYSRLHFSILNRLNKSFVQNSAKLSGFSRTGVAQIGLRS